MHRLLRGTLILGTGILVIWLETSRRARRPVEPIATHAGRNLAIAGLAAATVQLAETPVVLPVARWVTARGWGVTRALPGPGWLRGIVAVLLLDYTLYVWHVLTHRVPLLWRFHLVHHVDLDLDATTGLRFHAGELAISVPWRVAQIAAIGVSPAALASWQTLTLASVLFHHSNTRLPERFEAVLSRLLATPRLHAIHHSIDPAQTDSNFSSGLSIWDRLHGTWRLDAQPEDVTIGVSGYQDPEAVALARLLRLPFVAPLAGPGSISPGPGGTSRAPEVPGPQVTRPA